MEPDRNDQLAFLAEEDRKRSEREESIRYDEEEGILDCFHGKKKTISAALLVVSFFFILIALLAPFYLEGFLQSQIDNQKIVDSPNSDNYENWLHSDDDDDLPVHVSYYFWNITNPDDFLAGTDKPMFEQVGPYEYVFHLQKVNVTFSNDSKTVDWWPWAYYTYWPEPEDPSLDHANDLLLIPNLGLQGMYYFFGELCYTDLFMDAFINTNSTFYTRLSPNEIIFGYENLLIVALNQYLPNPMNPLVYVDPNYTSPEDLFNRTDGPYTSDTGHDDLDLVSKIVKWNGMTNMSKYWGSGPASEIQGTLGDQYSKPINIRQKYTIWLENIWRGINLTYLEQTEYKGINLDRFQMDPDTLKNASQNPDNSIWFQFGPSGVMNSSKAAWAPVFISKPNFLDADPYYTSQIYNMTPNPDLHNFYVDIEPITGFLMRMILRFQVNYYVQPTYDQPNVKPVYYPICWNQYEFGMTDKRASEFTDSVYTIRDVELGLLWGCLGLTVVTMIVCFIAYGYLKFFHLTPEKRAERSSLLLSGSRPNSRTNSATNLAGSRTNSGTKLAGSRTNSATKLEGNRTNSGTKLEGNRTNSGIKLEGNRTNSGPRLSSESSKNSSERNSTADSVVGSRRESDSSVFSSSASLLQNQEDEGL